MALLISTMSSECLMRYSSAAPSLTWTSTWHSWPSGVILTPVSYMVTALSRSVVFCDPRCSLKNMSPARIRHHGFCMLSLERLRAQSCFTSAAKRSKSKPWGVCPHERARYTIYQMFRYFNSVKVRSGHTFLLKSFFLECIFEHICIRVGVTYEFHWRAVTCPDEHLNEFYEKC